MINTSQQINPSYGYLWWLNGKTSHMLPSSQFVFSGSMNPEAPSDMYAAMGRDGQFLNVVPSQNLVWVRMGEAPDGLPVPYLLNNAIWAYINELNCTTTDIKQDVHAEISVQMYPNPVHDELFLNADKQIEKLSIIGSDGKLLRVLHPGTKTTNLTIGDLHPGLYFLKAELQGKEQRMLKFIKE